MNSDHVAVVCSCKKKTIVRFDRRALSRDGKPGGKYIPDNPTWKFAVNHDLNKRAGWNCGEPNHYQLTP